MDLGSLLNIGASLLKDKVNADESSIGDALSSILSNEEGGLDLSNIISAVGNSDLGSIVSTWIGNGENAPIDADGIKNILGEDKINEFAQKLGIDTDTAADALKDVLPNVVDKATPEGDTVLEQLGGIDGLLDIAKKLF